MDITERNMDEFTENQIQNEIEYAIEDSIEKYTGGFIKNIQITIEDCVGNSMESDVKEYTNNC